MKHEVTAGTWFRIARQALLCVLLPLSTAAARPPQPPAPLAQSQLVDSFLAVYRLPSDVALGLELSLLESAAAAELWAPDLALYQRAELRSGGGDVTLTGSLTQALVNPTAPVDRDIAATSRALTQVSVVDARATSLREFLELLVELEHTEDSLELLRAAVTTVQRSRPAWLVPNHDEPLVPIDELAAATDARMALADARALERRLLALRRRVATASATPAVHTRSITRDLALFDLDVHAWEASPEDLNTCAQRASEVERARLAARLDGLSETRAIADTHPSLSLRLEGTLGLGSTAVRDAAVRISLNAQVPVWEPISGALSISASVEGASQELHLGWPNRYRARAPEAPVAPQEAAQQAVVEVRRHLADLVATLASLNYRRAALLEFEGRMHTYLKATDSEPTGFEAVRRSTATRSQLLDLEGSIRLHRLELSFLCHRGPFATYAP